MTQAPPIHQEAPPLRVVDGVILVGQTRVPIDTVVYCHREGLSAEQIAQSYDAMSLLEVYGAIAYYLRHRQEVDEYIRRREAESEALREQITSDPKYREGVEQLIERGRVKGLRP